MRSVDSYTFARFRFRSMAGGWRVKRCEFTTEGVKHALSPLIDVAPSALFADWLAPWIEMALKSSSLERRVVAFSDDSMPQGCPICRLSLIDGPEPLVKCKIPSELIESALNPSLCASHTPPIEHLADLVIQKAVLPVANLAWSRPGALDPGQMLHASKTLSITIDKLRDQIARCQEDVVALANPKPRAALPARPQASEDRPDFCATWQMTWSPKDDAWSLASISLTTGVLRHRLVYMAGSDRLRSLFPGVEEELRDLLAGMTSDTSVFRSDAGSPLEAATGATDIMVQMRRAPDGSVSSVMHATMSPDLPASLRATGPWGGMAVDVDVSDCETLLSQSEIVLDFAQEVLTSARREPPESLESMPELEMMAFMSDLMLQNLSTAKSDKRPLPMRLS